MPRCGSTSLVCVDGPSGSGKTTLAAQLARRLDNPPVLHMDDLYPGWDGLAAAIPLLHDAVVAPLAAGVPARYPRWDWTQGAYAQEHVLGNPPLLVVEGVGAGARAVARYAALLIWVEAPLVERFRRGMARDGGAYLPYWRRWAAQEQVHFTTEGTRARADVVVDTSRRLGCQGTSRSRREWARP